MKRPRTLRSFFKNSKVKLKNQKHVIYLSLSVSNLWSFSCFTSIVNFGLFRVLYETFLFCRPFATYCMSQKAWILKILSVNLFWNPTAAIGRKSPKILKTLLDMGSIVYMRGFFLHPIRGGPQGADPTPPLPLKAVKAGRNHLSDIAKPYQLNVKQRSCVDVSSPYKRKCWTNSVVPLYQSLLWGMDSV